MPYQKFVICSLFVLAQKLLIEGELIDIDLGASASWNVRSASPSRNISIGAKVPGGIFSDLQNANLIMDDIYYRFNDFEYRWVGETNWTYWTQFLVDSTTASMEVVKLDLHGVDTVASVLVNGQPVGSTRNMFVRYNFDVKNFIRDGWNDLEIQFQSPVEYAQEEFDRQVAEEHLVPPACIPEELQGICHANHIRKMQASFSWDWGPAFASMGIYKAIHLVAFNAVRFKYVHWTVEELSTPENLLEVVNFEATFEMTNKGSGSTPAIIQYEIVGVTDVLSERVDLQLNEDGEVVVSVPVAVPKADIELWWPNGAAGGKQRLYDVRMSLLTEDGGTILDSVYYEQSLGFRTIKLIQEPVKSHQNISEDLGLTFYFEVNGEPIFMKGSNWIPGHVLPEQATRDLVEDLLWSAKEVGMNMLRVWGGGIYEQDWFYEITDRLGILIWHDFMFACSMYQAGPSALENAAEEVKHQVRRLSRHPSIALWAGNNENELALRQNWYGTDHDFETYKQDYLKLYVDTIKPIVEGLDPIRPFVVSSPSNGLQSEAEGWIGQSPGDPRYGDVHVYNYLENTWNYQVFPRPRFCSEYGFQSFPSFEILERVSEVWDWSYNSQFSNHRQRHPSGNLELIWQIHLNLHMDVLALDTIPGWQEFLYLTQIYQAVSLKTESEHYRRWRSHLNEKGEGNTMGALYWQLNDIWPGASWTSLEFGGKWKMSHYFAERFFADILLSPIIDEHDNLQIYLVCDSERQEEAEIEMATFKLNSLTPTTIRNIPVGVTCSTPGSRIVHEMPMSEVLKNGNCSAGNPDSYRYIYCLFQFQLKSGLNVLASNNLHSSPKSLVLPGEDKSHGIQVPNVSVQVIGQSNTVMDGPYLESYDLIVSTDNIAFYVWLEATGLKGRFSNNGLILTASSTAIQFLSKQATSQEELKERLTIRAYIPY